MCGGRSVLQRHGSKWAAGWSFATHNIMARISPSKLPSLFLTSAIFEEPIAFFSIKTAILVKFPKRSQNITTIPEGKCVQKPKLVFLTVQPWVLTTDTLCYLDCAS